MKTTTECMHKELNYQEEQIGPPLGRAIRRARRATCWGVQDVARKLGCSTDQYRRIERGAIPDSLTLVRILQLLELSADDALGLAPQPGPLTFSALREANTLRLPQFPNAKGESYSVWTVADWLMATMGELGELADLCKKVRRGDFPESEVKDRIGDELADVAIYLDHLASKLDVDLAHAIERKFNVTSERIGSDVRLNGNQVQDGLPF